MGDGWLCDGGPLDGDEQAFYPGGILGGFALYEGGETFVTGRYVPDLAARRYRWVDELCLDELVAMADDDGVVRDPLCPPGVVYGLNPAYIRHEPGWIAGDDGVVVIQWGSWTHARNSGTRTTVPERLGIQLHRAERIERAAATMTVDRRRPSAARRSIR